MRVPLFMLVSIPLLSACEQDASVPAHYTQSSNKRAVDIDEETVYVVLDGPQLYAAWGGGTDGDSNTAYRQKRAIELVSHCRVVKVTPTQADHVLHARVKC